MVLLGALGFVVMLAVVGWWLVYDSSTFAVRTVSVVGNHELTSAQVLAAADVTTGDAMASVDLGAVQRRVAALPLVASAQVGQSWPNTVVITVRERTLAAVVADPRGGYDRIDPGGIDFGPVPALPPGAVIVAAGAGTLQPDRLRDALAVVAAVEAPSGSAGTVQSAGTGQPAGTGRSVLPGALPVQTVTVVSAQDIRLTLAGGAEVEWGGAQDSPAKARVLRVLLPRRAAHYDVSAPGAPAITGRE